MAFTAALRRIGPQLGNNYRGVNVSSRISYSLSSILCGEGSSTPSLPSAAPQSGCSTPSLPSVAPQSGCSTPSLPSVAPQSGCSTLPPFSSAPRPGYTTVDDSCFSFDWIVPEVPPDPTSFYEEYLREPLKAYYKEMREPLSYEKLVLVSIEELVDVAIRYPPFFRRCFFQEVCDSGIIVNDPTIFPLTFRDSRLSFLARVPSSPSRLRQPIQILCPSLPQNGWVKFYTDSSPGRWGRYPGCGGVVSIDSLGGVELSAVVLPHDSPFATEVYGVYSTICHARAKGLKECSFYLDNADVVDGLNGRRNIRDGYKPLYSQIWHQCSFLDKREFVHFPREVFGLSDAISRLKQRFIEKNNFMPHGDKPYYHVHQHDEILRKNQEIERHRYKVENQIPVLRAEPFTSQQLSKWTTDRLINENRRWCPERDGA